KVPVPETSANDSGSPGTPFPYASTTCAVTLAVFAPPTHGGVLASWIAVGGPGAIVIAFDVAGALPASSCATITIGPAKEEVALTERWPGSGGNCAGSGEPRPAARVVAFSTVSVTCELISWITEPASFVTLTVSVNASPARAVAGDTAATRWKPLEIALT